MTSFLDCEIRQDAEEPRVSWGSAEFSGEEPLFRDHFPGRPLVPGVLLIEILRNHAERVLTEEGASVRLEEASRVRFVQTVEPPIRIETRIERDAARPLEVKGTIFLPDGSKAATALLRFTAVGDAE